MEILEVECAYCGSLIELRKAVRLNVETGEYEYACVNCALKWDKSDPRYNKIEPEDLKKIEDISKSN
jgi:DNA-directed RNA polymerase subunit RPC12/RpoP